MHLEPVAVLPRFRDRDRLVALVGSWAGGGAIVAFDPVECADDVRVLAREGAPPQVVTPDRPKVAPAWLGVLGYRVGGLVEHVPWQSHRPDPQPDCDLACYETLLRYDADSGTWWFEGTCRADALGRAREACDAIQDILAGPDSQTEAPRPFTIGTFTPTPSLAAHADGVRQVLDHIGAGDIFKPTYAFASTRPTPATRSMSSSLGSMGFDQPTAPSSAATLERSSASPLSCSCVGRNVGSAPNRSRAQRLSTRPLTICNGRRRTAPRTS